MLQLLLPLNALAENGQLLQIALHDRVLLLLLSELQLRLFQFFLHLGLLLLSLLKFYLQLFEQILRRLLLDLHQIEVVGEALLVLLLVSDYLVESVYLGLVLPAVVLQLFLKLRDLLRKELVVLVQALNLALQANLLLVVYVLRRLLLRLRHDVADLAFGAVEVLAGLLLHRLLQGLGPRSVGRVDGDLGRNAQVPGHDVVCLRFYDGARVVRPRRDQLPVFQNCVRGNVRVLHAPVHCRALQLQNVLLALLSTI